MANGPVNPRKSPVIPKAIGPVPQVEKGEQAPAKSVEQVSVENGGKVVKSVKAPSKPKVDREVVKAPKAEVAKPVEPSKS